MPQAFPLCALCVKKSVPIRVSNKCRRHSPNPLKIRSIRLISVPKNAAGISPLRPLRKPPRTLREKIHAHLCPRKCRQAFQSALSAGIKSAWICGKNTMQKGTRMKWMQRITTDSLVPKFYPSIILTIVPIRAQHNAEGILPIR